MKIHQGPVFIDDMVNSIEVAVQFKTKPETIDAVRQLILQDCHVTYREIETTLGIHSVLLEHLTVKKFVSVGFHTICESLIKRLVSIGRKKCSKNTIAV